MHLKFKATFYAFDENAFNIPVSHTSIRKQMIISFTSTRIITVLHAIRTLVARDYATANHSSIEQSHPLLTQNNFRYLYRKLSILLSTSINSFDKSDNIN